MTPELAGFSDWVLALLPRLFLFPGGLWMIVGVAMIRFGSGGIAALHWRSWAADLKKTNTWAVATAWAALALLPLPGSASLPTPIDRWTLAALGAISFLLDLRGVKDQERRWYANAAAGITFALIAPLASAQRLLISERQMDIGWTAAPWLVSVLAGIVALLWLGEGGIGAQVRWLLWASMALSPVLIYLPDNWLTGSAIIPLTAGVLWAGRKIVADKFPAPKPLIRGALLIQWLPALVGLMALLVWR